MVAVALYHRVGQWMNIPAFLAMLLWGSTYAVIKIAVRDHFTSLNLATMRVALGAVVLFLALLAAERDWKVQKKDLPVLALMGLCGLAVFQVFFIEGLKYTTASNSSVVMSTSPIFAALIVALTRVESLAWRTVAGIILAFAGVALVAQREGLSLGTGGLRGDLLNLVASVSWGAFVVMQMPLLKRYSPLKVMTYATIFGAVFMLPFTASEALAQDWGAVSLLGWTLGIYYIVFSGFVAMVLWGWGLRSWGAAKTSAYSFLNPIFGILSGVLFLGERLVPIQVLGSLAVFAGLALARK